MGRSFLFALSNAGLPSLDEWQRAIDRLDLLARVELLAVEVGPGRGCRARIGEAPTLFVCEQAAPETLLGERYPHLRSAWSRAYGFGVSGRLIEATAAVAACMSYVLATGGALKRSGAEPTRDLSRARAEIDLMIAGSLKLEDAYYARYPSDIPTEPDGPATLEIIVHRGGA